RAKLRPGIQRLLLKRRPELEPGHTPGETGIVIDPRDAQKLPTRQPVTEAHRAPPQTCREQRRSRRGEARANADNLVVQAHGACTPPRDAPLPPRPRSSVDRAAVS